MCVRVRACDCAVARGAQGLDSVLEGHGVLPPTSPGQNGAAAAEQRRSRELMEQQETARLMSEKREADLVMLEKLRGAGATADTLRCVETAIRRRAEAGVYTGWELGLMVSGDCGRGLRVGAAV